MIEATQPKKSDLPVRAASAVVMIAVAGTALWLGGWWWTVFVTAVALGVLWEWLALVEQMTTVTFERIAWTIAGLAYVGLAALVMVVTADVDGFPLVLLIIAAVVATDIGAYFTGRTLGGPKIAPKISPSKTWSGLGGGMVASSAVVVIALLVCPPWGPASSTDLAQLGVFGACTAIVAQAGDFLESSMKRRAGVKDSGSIIPGHGGLLDRVDGLLAVCFVLGLVFLFFALLLRP